MRGVPPRFAILFKRFHIHPKRIQPKQPKKAGCDHSRYIKLTPRQTSGSSPRHLQLPAFSHPHLAFPPRRRHRRSKPPRMAPLFNIIALRTAMIGHPPCARPSNTSHPSPVMRIAARPIGESSPPHARSPPSAHRADTSPGGATSVDGHPDKRAPPRCAPHSHLTAPLRSGVSALPLCMHAPPRVRLSADLRRARALPSLDQSNNALTPYPPSCRTTAPRPPNFREFYAQTDLSNLVGPERRRRSGVGR